jgi:hypothetical protein
LADSRWNGGLRGAPWTIPPRGSDWNGKLAIGLAHESPGWFAYGAAQTDFPVAYRLSPVA